VDDLRLVLADLARRPVAQVTLTPIPLLAADWSAAALPGVLRRPNLTHVVDLRDGWDATWKRYRPKVRESVRRAQRAGLEVRCHHGEAALPVFDELYGRQVAHWAQQRGRPGWVARLAARHEDTPGRLAAVARRLGSACAIWTAHLNGEPVAASVTLTSPGHGIGWVSAMDRELVRQTRASYLLESLAIEEACRSGARYFHMGESDPGSGVAQHKAQFGARELTYDSLVLERLPLSAVEQGLRSAVRKVADRRVTAGPA
jgi:CelD/BcsL family acetyltransferase involved in cellulose biosynthesis